MSTGNINLMYRQKYINSFLPVELKNKSFKMFHNCKYPESVLYSSPSLQDLCKSAGISTFPRTKWYGGGRHWIGSLLCAFFEHNSLPFAWFCLFNLGLQDSWQVCKVYNMWEAFSLIKSMFDLFCHFHLHVFFSLSLIFWTMISRLIHFVAPALAITDNNIHEAGEGKITPHSLDRSQSPITVKLARLTLTKIQSQYSNQPHHTQRTQF